MSLNRLVKVELLVVDELIVIEKMMKRR